MNEQASIYKDRDFTKLYEMMKAKNQIRESESSYSTLPNSQMIGLGTKNGLIPEKVRLVKILNTKLEETVMTFLVEFYAVNAEDKLRKRWVRKLENLEKEDKLQLLAKYMKTLKAMSQNPQNILVVKKKLFEINSYLESVNIKIDQMSKRAESDKLSRLSSVEYFLINGEFSIQSEDDASLGKRKNGLVFRICDFSDTESKEDASEAEDERKESMYIQEFTGKVKATEDFATKRLYTGSLKVKKEVLAQRRGKSMKSSVLVSLIEEMAVEFIQDLGLYLDEAFRA